MFTENDSAPKTDNGMPRGVATPEDTMFDVYQNEIAELPEPVVQTIVCYYLNDRYLNRYVEKMSEGLFDGIALDRRKNAIIYCRELGVQSLISGLRALAVLNAFVRVRLHRDEICKDEQEAAETLLASPKPQMNELQGFLEPEQSKILQDFEKNEETRHDEYREKMDMPPIG